MNNPSSRSESIAQQVGGKIKEIAGKVIGNKDMENQGKAKQLEGKARDEATKAVETATGKVEQAVEGVKDRAGAAVDKVDKKDH
jgi:uncharacterized protein YjbJ (UPF0337 family)